jgi:hypothetical protein
LLEFPDVKTELRDLLNEGETTMCTSSKFCLIFSADMPERKSDDAKRQQLSQHLTTRSGKLNSHVRGPTHGTIS